MRERIAAALTAAENALEQDAEPGGAPPGLRLATLRLVMAAIKDRDAVAVGAESEGGDASTRAGEAEILSLLGTMVQQRRDSADTYEQDGRIELAERERAEGAVIEEFLPPPMSREETGDAVRAVIEEIGASGVRDIGRVMAALKSRYSGRMDFAAAGEQVREALG